MLEMIPGEMCWIQSYESVVDLCVNNVLFVIFEEDEMSIAYQNVIDFWGRFSECNSVDKLELELGTVLEAGSSPAV